MTPADFLGRVRALLPSVRERTAQAERERRLPEDTVRDFLEAGLFRCLQPKRYGGYELDPQIFYQAVIEVAAVCGSTGWIFGVIGIHNWHLALFPPAAQDDVWGEDNDVLVSTSVAPTGTVEAVPGGFRLRGRWSFSSGCDFCRWAVLGGVVPGDPPDARVFLVPRRDYEIDDNWHVVGLCGTGSKDLVVEDAFVPEHRTHSYRDAFEIDSPGAAVNDAPLYRLPWGLTFPYALTAPAIGVALGALDSFREQAATRVVTRDGSRAAEDRFTHLRLAEAAAEVGSAHDRLIANFAEMMRCLRGGTDVPLAARARYRWDAAKATDWSVSAVDRVFAMSGGRGIFLGNPLQRAWRDIHAMQAHAANNLERAATIFGRSEFGLPPQDLRF